MLASLVHDIQFGLRTLIKNPVFTIVVVFTLSLGIGANTAIFSVINAVLLRPLPLDDPERLVLIYENNRIRGWSRFAVAPGNFAEWRSRTRSFDQMALFTSTTLNLVGAGEPEQLQGTRASASFFDVLGVKPALGRPFLSGEDTPGKNQVAMLSHGLWQRLFGSEPQIIGKTLMLNGSGHEVIGVMPVDFVFPSPRTEIWVPASLSETDLANRGSHSYAVIARLKPGVELGRGQAELNAIAAGLEQQYPETNTGWGVNAGALSEAVIGSARPALIMLMCAVAFVLLIASANVANLLIARTAARWKEIAIRSALGASRYRLVQQLLTESILVSLLGGAFGIVLAVNGVDILLSIDPAALPRSREVKVDGQALVFTLGVSLLTGILFGLLPALLASRPNIVESLKEAGRASTPGLSGAKFRSILVVSEIALSLVLLIGAGLMIRSFQALRDVKPGFEADNLLTMNLSLSQIRYPEATRQATFFTDVLNRIASIPGVEVAGAVSPLPFVGDRLFSFDVEGRPSEDLPSANYYAASPDYFRAMGIPLLRGRFFTNADDVNRPRVAIINETMARRFFAGEDPIGKRMNITSDPPAMREIVGIVGDVKQYGLDTTTPAQMYEPHAQRPWSSMSILIRAQHGESIAAAVRTAIRSVDSEQPVSNVQTMAQIIANSISSQRFSMLLMTLFAFVALTMAAVGVYGIVSYSVTQRTREIGLRMALGAKAYDVFRLVVGQGLKLTLAGLTIGIAGALALTRWMSDLLFGISATDTLTFVIISVVLAAVSLAACYIPARRAMKVDPMEAIRYE